MKTRVFTAGVLMHGRKLLILKRKEDDDTHPGLWDLLGGHFESGESAEECMTREAKEESGLDVNIIKPGRPVEYSDQYGRAIEIPFLLSCRSVKVRVSEHTDFRWIDPRVLGRYRRVPGLDEAVQEFCLWKGPKESS